MSHQVPIIDLGDKKETIKKNLVHACTEFGVFYVKYPPAYHQLLEEALAVSQRFFDLPIEEKLKIDFLKSPHWRGYSPIGEEVTAGRVDMREQIDFGIEASPRYPPHPQDPDYAVIEGPNIWPSDEMKDIILRYQEAMNELSKTLANLLNDSLSLEPHRIAGVMGDTPYSRMKVVRYPSKSETREKFPNEVNPFGCGAHKDYMFWGFLLQEPGIVALECQLNNGEWVACPPIDGTLVCSLGEMLEVATGGVLKATTHRVQVPDDRSRVSLNWFVGPHLDHNVEPIPLNIERAGEGVKFDGRDDNRLYQLAGYNYIKGMVRSHPVMCAKYHKELYKKYGHEQESTLGMRQ